VDNFVRDLNSGVYRVQSQGLESGCNGDELTEVRIRGYRRSMRGGFESWGVWTMDARGVIGDEPPDV
jgi:hypothetical protein